MLLKLIAIVTCSLTLLNATASEQSEAETTRHEKREDVIQKSIIRIDEEFAKASNPEAPAPLSQSSNVSLSELKKKWDIALVQVKNNNFTTIADTEILKSMAIDINCTNIIGIIPTGFPTDDTNRQKLSGATLFAECPEGNYVIISTYFRAGNSGNRLITPPESFKQSLAGFPARKLFYKSKDGLEKRTLSVLHGDFLYAVEYWTSEKNKINLQQKNKTHTNNLDNIQNTLVKLNTNTNIKN